MPDLKTRFVTADSQLFQELTGQFVNEPESLLLCLQPPGTWPLHCILGLPWGSEQELERVTLQAVHSACLLLAKKLSVKC